MNRDDIIRMAQEANRYANNDETAEGYKWHLVRDEHFAALVAAAEREACAKVCELWNATPGSRLAAAIRARGQQ